MYKKLKKGGIYISSNLMLYQRNKLKALKFKWNGKTCFYILKWPKTKSGWMWRWVETKVEGWL